MEYCIAVKMKILDLYMSIRINIKKFSLCHVAECYKW